MFGTGGYRHADPRGHKCAFPDATVLLSVPLVRLGVLITVSSIDRWSALDGYCALLAAGGKDTMVNSTRLTLAIASLVAAATITQVSVLSPSSAQEAPVMSPLPSPVATSPAHLSPSSASPALPMPEADAGSALPIPQLVLHGPWLDDLSPDMIPSTTPPRLDGGQFRSNCTACSSR